MTYTATDQLTITQAINAYTTNHRGQPFTADTIIRVYGPQLPTPAKGIRRAVLSHLADQTKRGRLIRVSDGTYTTPPEDQAVTVNIGTPTTTEPVNEPANGPIDNHYAQIHARGLLAQAADILDNAGCTYTYQCTRNGIQLNWDRTQP